jgi:hypothetical protein
MMKSGLRNTLAAFGGIIVCMASLSGLEAMIPLIFDTAPAPKTEDAVAWAAYMDAMPLGAMLALLPSYFIAGFLGGYSATLSSAKPASLWPVVAVTIVYSAGGIANSFMLPQPTWLIVASMACILVSPYCGYLLKK